MMSLEGIAHVFGDHVNTDYIISGKYKSRFTDIKQMTPFLMEDIRPGFYKEIKQGDFIVGGINFGCGSSREHAPQAIRRAGFDAIIAESFAEIFFGNSTGLGMPCVCATAADIQDLAAAIEAEPQLKVSIDLESMPVSYGDQSFAVTIPDSAREALLSDRWDPIQELLDNSDAIKARAEALPYV